jgi:tRNA/tmRNA/rRNA uracil-C5-methylase (TrmA/RlmC/RlmD family)
MSRKSRVIEFTIDRVDFPNRGKATFEDRNIRIKGGLPGQKVRAKVAKRRKDY